MRESVGKVRAERSTASALLRLLPVLSLPACLALEPFDAPGERAARPGVVAPQRLPIGGLTVVRFRNAHLIYALTWFGLAGLSLFGFALARREGQSSGAKVP